jgi:hypothetical protein
MSAAEKAPPPVATADALADATRLLAEVRSRCCGELGLTPQQFAELLLPEALLAMMVAGMRQEQVEEVFARFAREEICAWFLQVKRTVGYCDCEREARGEHAASCVRNGMMPVAQDILDNVTRGAGAHDA